MVNSLHQSVLTKIKTYDEISPILDSFRKEGLKIVQCHGVFDLLHPGHMRHFREAKAQGDVLVVSITQDRFVNKGPGRPAFTESLRLEALASLEDIDYVVLNDAPDAISAIERIKPTIYVKGIEYKNHNEDVTGKISLEAKAVENLGGKIHYTNDIVFSSSSLLNKYFDSQSPEVIDFLNKLKKQFTSDQIIKHIEALFDLKVLVIGDAIIDEYQYAEPLGQSGKGHHMVVRSLEKEIFLGGSLIIANHIAQFSSQVTLVTALGRNCPFINFIQQNLDPKVDRKITYLEDTTTLIKKRYVHKDGKTLTKLFETYSGQDELLNQSETDRIIKFLATNGSKYDLVLSCDFGNGFTNPQMIDAICDVPAHLALNTQTNSGNRGFNVVTNYKRADFISLNEPELRLAAHNKTSSLEGIAADICQVMNCPFISITRGIKGVSCYSMDGTHFSLPALVTNSVDRIGAGDSYLSLAAMCSAKKYPPLLSSFIGSLAAAISVQMIGNQEPIKKDALCKFAIRLLK
ncbi:MAG: adenylyltransferase/cytidyltransferase family protein [Verrucomicrobia bacterium]|nr:adenylyltransferase/cytidyltransferase family protein [Verrucomicrobiota bacterium]